MELGPSWKRQGMEERKTRAVCAGWGARPCYGTVRLNGLESIRRKLDSTASQVLCDTDSGSPFREKQSMGSRDLGRQGAPTCSAIPLPFFHILLSPGVCFCPFHAHPIPVPLPSLIHPQRLADLD